MDASVAIGEQGSLNDRQRVALISLLADEDTCVYQSIRKILLGFGPKAVPWLHPYTLDKDPILRRRAQEVCRHIERQEADNLFVAFCVGQSEELDLEKGAWLLARTQYPEINVAAYQALLDHFSDELLERLVDVSGCNNTLVVFNQFLFEELGFRGNEDNYYDPDNNYINRIIDRRTGNPLGLCLIYLAISRRLRLPIAGIGMPGHFVCRYQSPVTEVYIDVFNQGRLLSKAECVKHLVQSGHGYVDGYLTPVSPRRTLLRLCMNLQQTYVDLEDQADASRLQRYIVALSK